jgi:hypothetical protein
MMFEYAVVTAARSIPSSSSAAVAQTVPSPVASNLNGK